MSDKITKSILVEIEEFIDTCKLLDKAHKFSVITAEADERLIDATLLEDVRKFIDKERQVSAYDLFNTYVNEGIKAGKWLSVSEFMEIAEIDNVTMHNWRRGIHIPGKEKMLRIVITLDIGYEKTQDLLAKCRMTLLNNDTRDIIVTYFINKGEHDIYKVEDYLNTRELSILPKYK